MADATLPDALTGERDACDTATAGRISWYRSTPEDAGARPLLLVHSVNAAASAAEVRPLYQRYGGQRPTYAIDLPGYGFAERSERRYTPQMMSEAILALCARIRAEHGDLAIDALALSLSSEFLARAALAQPSWFRSLALVSPTGFSRASLREGASGSTLARPLMHALFAWPRWRRGLFDLLTRRSVIAYFLRRTWGSAAIDGQLLDYDYATARMPGAEHAPLQFLSGYLFSGDSGTLYRGLRQPVWVSHGVRGDFVRYRGLQQLAAQPNWTVTVLPTGALPHFELPEEFCRRYDEWLAPLGTTA